MKKRKQVAGILLLLTVILVIVIGISASLGSANIPVMDCFQIMASRIPGLRNLVDVGEIKEVYQTIVMNVRLPRILLAGLTGCGLAVVGAAFQGLFRNPLADPHVLGVSSGAALGATFAMLSGISFRVGSLGFIGVCAFVGAIITVAIVYTLSGVGGRSNMTSMLLTGTAISTMLSAIISLLMTLHRDEIEKVYLWTLGSFSSASWGKVQYLTWFVGIGVAVLLCYSNDLNVLLTGEDSAKSLGINITRVKRILIIFASLLVGACVSVSGIIGFVGLLIPHCTRLIAGPDHRRLLPLCCFSGAIFMILCDTIARTITQPSELPVGVITALFGAPYFVFLLYYNQKKINR